MNDAKEEVRSKLAIEDVIGEYVQLKRSGRYWRGLSPFTNEHTPSFFVTPERDIWHDFSSNKGGDIFSFVMEVEGLDFFGALELLAKKAGVDLTRYDKKAPRDLGQRKNRVIEMNNIATNYFMHEMTKSQTAMEYIFKKRGLMKATVLEWGIGFAPENSGLKNALLARKFAEQEIREAGLIGARGGEMFRSRMTIPLRDSQGQIVGFTGRIIGDGEPKYLNTPATIVYDKGRQVFGLNFAKNAIRKEDFVVLVEGNLDVISSYQAGVKNIVACAGTALTRDHLKSLGRLSHNIRLCFDGDRAGIAATERAIILAEPLELKLSVISFDIAKDPDEIITKFGAEKWLEVITKNTLPAVEWVIKKYCVGVFFN
ncbi:MAG: DNA primase [Candidatus Nomurabacteria bacterium]|jgi:DNA primase|nr:DNA primase [Candidatus Nomurabacteria bacterium]